MTTTITNVLPTSISHGIHVVYQYFSVRAAPPRFPDEKARERQEEYDFCLHTNARHPSVTRVHVLLENQVDADRLQAALRAEPDASVRCKVNPVHLGKRMHYSDAFAYANAHLAGHLVVVTNADIYLQDGVERVLHSTLFSSRRPFPVVLALTRHEPHRCVRPSDEAVVCGCPFLPAPPAEIPSHDQFWFAAPVPPSIVAETDHVQNVWGAEHSVVKAFLRARYMVLDPARSLRVYHKHRSDARPWMSAPQGARVIANHRQHRLIHATTLPEAEREADTWVDVGVAPLPPKQSQRPAPSASASFAAASFPVLPRGTRRGRGFARGDRPRATPTRTIAVRRTFS